MSKKNKHRGQLRNPKRIPPNETWAGMRPDVVRRDNNAGMPNEESVIDEMEFRKEHIQ